MSGLSALRLSRDIVYGSSVSLRPFTMKYINQGRRDLLRGPSTHSNAKNLKNAWQVVQNEEIG